MDPYSNPDSQPERTLSAMIARLEDRGKNAALLKMIDRYGETLPHDHPIRLLELGCGTGVVIRRLAERLHPSSQMHGAM